MDKIRIIAVFMFSVLFLAAVFTACGRKAPAGPDNTTKTPTITMTSISANTATITPTATQVIYCADHSHLSAGFCVCDNNWFDCDGNPLNGCENNGACPSETDTPAATETPTCSWTPYASMPFTATTTLTLQDTATITATITPAITETSSIVPTSTVSPENTQSETPTLTLTLTSNLTFTPSETATFTITSNPTSTSTPTACATDVFGETGAINGYLSNYYLDASKYTCPVAAKIISIRVYAGVACGIRAGVYTDNSGVPGSFLAETSSASGGTGWRTINLITPVNVAAGDYWLAVTSDTASGICDTTGGDMKYCSFPAYGPLPNPLFGSPLLDFPNIHITAYAIYTCQ